MISLETWSSILVGVVLVVLAALVTVWWRQQTFRWPILLGFSLTAAPLLSWWSSDLFVVTPYRAGCDALCIGQRGAPIATHLIDGSGEQFLLLGFVINALLYLVLVLAWAAIVRAVTQQIGKLPRNVLLLQMLLGLFLTVGPVAFAPWFLAPPEAELRGDPQRIAINAQREVYLYDQEAPSPVLRVGLVDVRPRLDGQDGMRVCMKTYTFFYLPAGYMFMNMAPAGVHSTGGGVLPVQASCW